MIKTRDAKGKKLKTLPKTSLKDLKKYKKGTFINNQYFSQQICS